MEIFTHLPDFARCAPWFYDEALADKIANSATIILPENERQHFEARRVRENEKIVLFNGAGLLAEMTISKIARKEVALTYFRQARYLNEGNGAIATAIPKGKRWQIVIEKLTELNIRSIIPLKCDRSITVRGERSERAPEKQWIIEACKQARRAVLPQIWHETTLLNLLSNQDTVTSNALNVLIADPDSEIFYQSLAQKKINPQKDSLWLIGPEGGLTADELQLCRQRGAIFVSIGGNILRTETAALTVAALFSVGFLR